MLREATVKVEKLVDGTWKEMYIEEVVYVPSMRRNLFSIGRCINKYMQINFNSDGVKVVRNGNVVANGVMEDNVTFRMFIRPCKGVKYEAHATTANLQTWHARLGHLNIRALKYLAEKNIVDGITVEDREKLFFCNSCQYGKAHRLSPTNYFVTFKDDATGYCRVCFIKHKSDVAECIIAFGNEIKNLLGRPLKTFRSDNGLEYANRRVKDYFTS